MAVKKDTVEDTPLGTIDEKQPKGRGVPPEQKGYHGSQDDVKTPDQIERERAAELEQKQRQAPEDDADVTIKVTKDGE